MSDSYPTDHRWQAAERWLEKIGLTADLSVASADASFRRYLRCTVIDSWSGSNGADVAAGDTLILMDAPPEHEDAAQFAAVTQQLASAGLPVPQIFAEHTDAGFLLLTDFGSRDLLQTLLADRHSADAWYGQAGLLLHRLQSCDLAVLQQLPLYDEARLRMEMQLFPDWLCKTHLQLDWTGAQQRDWQQLTDALVINALQQPQVAVHRDFHSRNLMVTASESLGVIDYQDAMRGPLMYDLVSLLRDCYIEWPLEQVRQWACDWFHASAFGVEVSEAQQLRWFFLTGVQRQLKAAGIFARLAHRDGKWGYIDDIPRTLGYIVAAAEHYPELRPLAGMIESQCLPALGNG